MAWRGRLFTYILAYGLHERLLLGVGKRNGAHRARSASTEIRRFLAEIIEGAVTCSYEEKHKALIGDSTLLEHVNESSSRHLVMKGVTASINNGGII